MLIAVRLALCSLLVGGTLYAQITAPQINLTGNVGAQGFPVLNSGTLNFASDANHTMTVQESSATGGIKITSGVSLTATRSLVLPTSFGKLQFVSIQNATSGGQSIIVIGQSGTGITIPNGQSSVGVWYDGTNVTGMLASAGGISGQTANCAVKAATSTTATSPFPACDDGTKTTFTHPVAVNDGSGKNGTFGATAGTGNVTPAAGSVYYSQDGSDHATVAEGTNAYSRICTAANSVCSGSGSPGGSNTQIQVNSAGSFAGYSGFTYDDSTGLFSTPSVSTLTELVNPQTYTPCTLNGEQFGVNFGANCRLSEMLDGTWNVTTQKAVTGDATEGIFWGPANTWIGPDGSEAEFKNYFVRPTSIIKADQGILNANPIFCGVYGVGDNECDGYSYTSISSGLRWGSDEGSQFQAVHHSETGPISGTMALSGNTFTPTITDCGIIGPGTQACKPTSGARMVDTATSYTGRFTDAGATATIPNGCGFVNWLTAIPTSASLPVVSVYACTATADILQSNVTVSGSTVTWVSGQPFQSSWNGLHVIFNDSIPGTLSACNTSTCTVSPAPGISGATNMPIQTTSDVQVPQTITATGGTGTFSNGDTVCAISHQGVDDGDGFVEQSVLTAVSGSAGAQTLNLNLAMPGGAMFLIKGDCGWIRMNGDWYLNSFAPGYIYTGSLDGSTALVTSEGFSQTGLFSIPNYPQEPAIAATNATYQTTHAYSLGDLVFDGTSNCGGAGCIQKVTTPGTSGGSAPSWSATVGNAVTDGGGVVYTNTGPITLFTVFPYAARITRDDFTTSTNSSGVAVATYTTSQLEPATGMTTGDGFIIPNFDSSIMQVRKDALQCLTPPNGSGGNCEGHVISLSGPGVAGATSSAGIEIDNENPLSMYYAGSDVSKPMLEELPSALSLGFSGGGGQAFSNYTWSRYAPADSVIYVNAALPGQTSYKLLGDNAFGNDITLNNTGISFTKPITASLANGSTGTTQSLGDNTTKVATDAFVIANAGIITPSSVALPTTALSAGACDALSTTAQSVPGVSAASVFIYTANTDETAVTGYGAGGLTVKFAYGLVGGLPGVNIMRCNPTALPITPGALTINIRAFP